MYRKLMVRGLERHRKKGRRLFVLIALCCAALIFLLTFKNDFSRQNREQFVGMQTGHIQVLPKDSPVLAQSFSGSDQQVIPLLHLGEDFGSWIRGLPEVEEASAVITRNVLAYNLDSEYESWLPLIAIDPARKERLFPYASLLDGNDDIKWAGGSDDVPILRYRLQTEWGEKNADETRFVEKELAVRDEALPGFMSRVAGDFPSTFATGPYATKADLPRFLKEWEKAIADPGLKDAIPEKFLAEYDWKIDDAVTAASENAEPSMVGFLNKRVFQALYPDDILYLPEPIIPGKRISLQVSPFAATDETQLPTVIPARYVGTCELIPLYMPNCFVDIDAIRNYMSLDKDSATAWVIRLKDAKYTKETAARIQAHLVETGSDAKVADYTFLGQIYLTTGTAFSVVISILVAIFVVILLIFTVNLVLMSMIQRRREIGTSLALGLSNFQAIVVMTGEVAVIIAVSCLAGSALGFLLVLAGMRFGVPGMIFFAGARLKLTLQAAPFVQAWLIILPSSVVVAFIPLTRMLRLMPVDLFREER